MTTPDEQDRDGAPALPGRDVLDAWTVPEVDADFTDRVLGRVETTLSAEAVVSMKERRRGGVGLALVGIAMVAAAALVLSLVQLWSAGPGGRDQPPAVAAPIVVRIPVPVAVPTPVEPPVVAVEPLPAEATPVEPTPAEPTRVEPTREPPKSSSALKNPFGSSSKDATKAGKAAKPRDTATTAALRIGTAYSYAPAKVYIDGKPIGTTPIMKAKLAPGRHTVEWVWPDGERAKQTVTLEAGETKVLQGQPSDLKDPYR